MKLVYFLLYYSSSTTARVTRNVCTYSILRTSITYIDKQKEITVGTFLHFCLQTQVDVILIIEQSDFSMTLFEYFLEMFIPLILLDNYSVILSLCHEQLLSVQTQNQTQDDLVTTIRSVSSINRLNFESDRLIRGIIGRWNVVRWMKKRDSDGAFLSRFRLIGQPVVDNEKDFRPGRGTISRWHGHGYSAHEFPTSKPLVFRTSFTEESVAKASSALLPIFRENIRD